MEASQLELLVEYATKAPSGHNTQPWLFAMGEGTIRIRPDFRYALPVVDPMNRELFISLGCATENVRIAALSLGYKPTIAIACDGTITITLEENGPSSHHPLLQFIHTRQTNRRPYKGSIGEGVIATLQSVPLEQGCYLHCYKQGSDGFQTITEFVLRGDAVQLADAHFVEELHAWVRVNKAEVHARQDGLSYATFGAPSLPAWISRPIFRRSITPQKQQERDRELIGTSSHIALLSTVRNEAQSWVALGMSLQRILLHATQLGLAHAYLNQPNEVPALAAQMANALQLGNQTPCILLRLGHAKPAPRSPRRDLELFILKTQPPCES